jgi:FkbM family methyltransferase
LTGSKNVTVGTNGNVLSACTFLHGFASQEPSEEELNYHDFDHQSAYWNSCCAAWRWAVNLRSRLRDLYWRLRHAGKLPPRTKAETCFRLGRLSGLIPRHQLGEFVFSFGRLRYVDFASLVAQYQDIFVREIYDFDANKTEPLILDCGGNVGMSVIWFKQRYPSSKIIVLEADPEIAQVLENNLQSLLLEDVKVIKAAAWTENGSVPFRRDRADGGMITTSADGAVKAVRLADLINDTVDFLKMDIEGAEFDVLVNLCKTGKIKQVKRLACELHKREANGARIAELLTELSRHNFNVCIREARTAPDLSGESQVTPFPAVSDGKCLIQLYSWQL